MSDNNAFSRNGVGIWVDAGTVKLSEFRVWWNDVRGNGEGVHVTGDPPGTEYFHAECNWWNDASGPYDPTNETVGPPDCNPNPAGQYVSDYFHYRTDGFGGQYWWLDSPAASETECTSS